MRYCLQILLLTALVFGGANNLVLANPITPPVIITEFSTDEDWIEVYVYDSINSYELSIDNQDVNIHVDYDQIDPSSPYIVLDQTNTSGFDLDEEFGSIQFSYSSEFCYGTFHPIPAPPENESVARALSSNSSYPYVITPYPTPGADNDISTPAYGISNVVINEIGDCMYVPELSSYYTFIELYNRGDTPVNIGGWCLISSERVRIPADTVIEPGGYWVFDELIPEGTLIHNWRVVLQDDANVTLEMVGWYSELIDGYSFNRFPDGFATDFCSYSRDSAVDFRLSNPTPGGPNQQKYPVKSISVENDSVIVETAQSHQFYCLGMDTRNQTFRIQPAWQLEGDFASIDQTGLLTCTEYGNGTIIVNYEDFTATASVFGALTGTLQNDMTMTAESSPYCINGLIVPEDVTLTILPGADIIFYSIGGLRVLGKVFAEGTTSEPILFTSTANFDDYFNESLRYDNININGYSSNFKYCIFNNMDHALDINNTDQSSSTQISCCTFSKNVDCLIIRNGYVSISNCLIKGDGYYNYGITTYSTNTVKIHNNIFSNLTRAVGVSSGSRPNISNNLVYHCTTGFNLSQSTIQSRIKYNNIWNTTTPFSGDTGSLGTITTHNANGIPCDRYFNISADPLFVNLEAGDFRLCAGSPCIDAGDPSILDDDGTISDIGYLSGEPPVGIMSLDNTPKVLALGQNNPNPFNASTTVAFTLPVACRVTLDVYSIAGQKVARLVDSELDAGSHHATFDGAAQPSGIYLIRLIAGGRTLTGKMMMVK